eukprot:5324459-Pyramimonas_sp.AAC.1
MGNVPNNKCRPKQTAAAVGQAAFCLECTLAAAARTANPGQNEQELLLGIVSMFSAPISGARALPSVRQDVRARACVCASLRAH